MTTSTLSSTQIPLILRLFYISLRVPANALLYLTPQNVQRRWFGSDVFERYTAYYTWITNQLGHFTVGLFLYFAAWCLFFLTSDNTTVTCPAKTGGSAFASAFGFGVLFWLVYAVKEVADVVREQPDNERQFRLNIRELAIDGWTDSFFVASGIVFTHSVVWIMSNVVCGKSLNDGWDYFYFVVIAGCIGYAINRGLVFLPQKNRFDESFLPFYLRLARFYNKLSGKLWKPGADSGAEVGIVAEIEGVASGAEASPHVCIFGPNGSGKTALAVAIACELIVAPRRLRYLSANGLNMPANIGGNREDREALEADLLPVDDAEWIVVDHVSPSNDKPVIDEACRLTKPERKPVFILACDHEGSDRDEIVQSLSSALHAPCLAVYLGGVMPLSGSCAVGAFFRRAQRAQERRRHMQTV